ncbi:unnamed protein product [Gongylonema pulchrum]|uniref:Tyrosine-protein phosphatase domain-containing protein n=1 Tax=Gongylonema pulchrum TaxID=637853 RepID=A0A183EBP2_9BILA|nr:unnamed protein product [Gongylonema pulchrum]
MRKSRMGLIQTPEQLRFCWKTIADVLRQGCARKSAKPGLLKIALKRFGKDFLVGGPDASVGFICAAAVAACAAAYYIYHLVF